MKKQLKQIELVKPNLITERLSKEAEVLCESNTCTGFFGKANGDIENESDILF